MRNAIRSRSRCTMMRVATDWTRPADSGDGTLCSACEKPIRSAQICYEFELPEFGYYRFHFGCYGLFKADLIKRNWIDEDAR